MDSPADVVRESHARGITDEFITPHVLAGYDGMRDGDAIVMINFRADRVRQLLGCWLLPEETGLDNGLSVPQLSTVVGMTSYSDTLDARMTTLFAPTTLHQTLVRLWPPLASVSCVLPKPKNIRMSLFS